ncbi:hypothetical protein BDW42DRAFT_178925 [Aspergillus taichungensis]|uniref:Uncharacterized protein n=1 Tax=Aspergillus taichungensis TaxID=482145 RepID=A0A2J5HHA5_9EURO|nr:hypothetical protein BDW42DRAFT_178925 [Aspergillus taichungensis]
MGVRCALRSVDGFKNGRTRSGLLLGTRRIGIDWTVFLFLLLSDGLSLAVHLRGVCISGEDRRMQAQTT